MPKLTCAFIVSIDLLARSQWIQDIPAIDIGKNAFPNLLKVLDGKSGKYYDAYR